MEEKRKNWYMISPKKMYLKMSSEYELSPFRDGLNEFMDYVTLRYGCAETHDRGLYGLRFKTIVEC